MLEVGLQRGNDLAEAERAAAGKLIGGGFGGRGTVGHHPLREGDDFAQVLPCILELEESVGVTRARPC